MSLNSYWKWDLKKDVFDLGHSFWTSLQENYPDHFASPEKAKKYFIHTGLESVKDTIRKETALTNRTHFSISTEHQLKDPALSFTLKWMGEAISSGDLDEKPTQIIGKVTGSYRRDLSSMQMPNNPEYYQQLMDNLPDSVFFKDLSSRFIAINKICAEKFGLEDPSDAVGKTDFDFFNLSHAQEAFEDEQKIIKTGKPIIHKIEKETYQDHDTEPTWASTSKLPLYNRDGVITGTYGISTDITEQKKAQIQNERLKSQLLSVFDSNPNMLFVKDRAGKYVLVNEAKADFHNLNKDEIIGKTDFELGVEEESAKTFLKTDRQVIDNNESVFIPEDPVDLPNGQTTWYQTIKVPFQLLHSDERAALSVVMDITEHKKREEKLNKTLDIVSHQNQRLSNFAHIVSHNLRNHAGSISMILNLISMSESREEKEESLEQLKVASDRLNETIKDLNEIIDQQYKDQKVEREANIKELVDNTIQILTNEIKSKEAEFILDVPEDLSISYIPAYLESILLNLFSNAIKYSHPDRPPKIHVKVFEDDDHIHLDVQDNGKGIDLDKHGDKLFGMYETFHENDNAKGIGLYITKNQIESMGGQVSVQSKPGVGTKFQIRLN